MIIYLDTETTSLRPGNICQLSYLMQSGNKVTGKNFYFAVDQMDEGAQMVHGLSIEKLKILSGGKRFNDYAMEIFNDLSSASLMVAHNANFDLSFLTSEFERINLTLPDIKVFCSMKNTISVCKIQKKSGSGYKYPKLSELCEFFGITDNLILTYSKKAFGDSASFHDARFDTMAMFLALTKGKNEYDGLTVLNQYI